MQWDCMRASESGLVSTSETQGQRVGQEEVKTGDLVSNCPWVPEDGFFFQFCFSALTEIWVRDYGIGFIQSGASSTNQSQSVVKQNQSFGSYHDYFRHSIENVHCNKFIPVSVLTKTPNDTVNNSLNTEGAKRHFHIGRCIKHLFLFIYFFLIPQFLIAFHETESILIITIPKMLTLLIIVTTSTLLTILTIFTTLAIRKNTT